LAPPSQASSQDLLKEALKKIEEGNVASELRSESLKETKVELVNGDLFDDANAEQTVELTRELDDTYRVLMKSRHDIQEDINKKEALISMLTDFLEKQEKELEKLNEELNECAQFCEMTSNTKRTLKLGDLPTIAPPIARSESKLYTPSQSPAVTPKASRELDSIQNSNKKIKVSEEESKKLSFTDAPEVEMDTSDDSNVRNKNDFGLLYNANVYPLGIPVQPPPGWNPLPAHFV